jgi:hypothetical protein
MLLAGIALLALSLTSQSQEPKKIAATRGFEKVYELKVSEFDEFTVKEDRFLINNVLLRETPDGRRGQAAIKFAASIRNKAKGYESFTIVLIGMDEKKTPIWVAKAATSCDGNWLTTIQDYEIPVQRGTLKTTASVWMKISVSDQSDDE